MRQLYAWLCLTLLFCCPAAAETPFPALTGRVVDNAHFLSPDAQVQLEQELGDYERGTGNQLVVATIPTLGDQVLETYSVNLARHWQIGQKGKNNGAILLVAAKEHAVRIEVGYGLEGDLTDARSSQIIQQIIIPRFKEGEMEKGVMDGAHAVIAVLGGKGVPLPPDATAAQQVSAGSLFLTLLGVIVFLVLCARHPNLAWFLMQVLLSAGRSSGSGGGGGSRFSGGGGSFGGGGASGRW